MTTETLTGPRRVYMMEGLADLKFPKGTTAAQIAAIVGLPGGTAEKCKVVAWNGHAFEVLDNMTVDIEGEDETHTLAAIYWKDHIPHEYIMTLHYPVAPQTQESDWKNAIKAELNAAGTAWEPVWDDGDHHDYEEALIGAARNRFSGVVTAARIKTTETTNAATLKSARLVLTSIENFQEEVERELLAHARNLPLGYLLQNPHESHIRAPLRRAIGAVSTRWQSGTALQQAAHRAAGEKVGQVLRELRDHTYETRWGRAARLAAEASKAEGSEEDGAAAAEEEE